MTTSSSKRKRLPWSSEWTFALVDKYHVEIARVAKGFGLETFPVILKW